MPYIKIETSQAVSIPIPFIEEAAVFFAGLLDKPVNRTMVSITPKKLIFFNDGTNAAAYVEVKSIGLQTQHCQRYTEAVCDYLKKNLKIQADRIYIEFTDINGKQFGWNNQTF